MLTVLRCMTLRHLTSSPRRVALAVVGVAAGVALVFAATAIDATLQAVGDGSVESRVHARTFDSLSQLTDLTVLAALCAAFFVVFNSMSMSLMERRGTVALLHALGATRRQVAVAVVVEALVLGLLAAVLGVAAGLALGDALVGRVAQAHPWLDRADAGSLAVTPTVVLFALGSGVVVTVLGALVPALRIAALSPTEGLSPRPSYEWRPPGRLLRRRTWAARLPAIPLASLAIASLAKNAARTAINVVAIACASATAIGLGTALSSFEAELTRVFMHRYGAPLYVTAASYDGLTSAQPLSPRTVRALREVPGVRGAHPLRYRILDLAGEPAIVASASVVDQARAGVETPLLDTRAPSRSRLVEGLRSGGVVPSRYTAERHGLEIGSRVALPLSPTARSVEVVGISDGVLSLDSMYMDSGAYAALAGDRTADRVAIVPEGGTAAAAVGRRLSGFVASRGIDAVVETRAEVIDRVGANVRAMFSLARTLPLAAILIAALLVANTMFTSVAERRWELALCRALGMARAQVRAMVLAEALAIGALGALAAVAAGHGLAAALLAAVEGRYAWSIPYELQPGLAAAVAAVGIASAGAAAVLPARAAARTPIAEALART